MWGFAQTEKVIFLKEIPVFAYQRFLFFVLLVCPILFGCSCKKKADPAITPPANGSIPAGREMRLTSTAFKNGEIIPEKYTAEGLDVSPPLEWAGLPEQTRELALICEDPDAPSVEPWVHWVIYKISPTLGGLPEGLPQDQELGPPINAFQGKNSWSGGRVIGYRGPAPPAGHGTHHYHFTLFALDEPLEIEPGVDKNALLEAMHGKVIEKVELIGIFRRD